MFKPCELRRPKLSRSSAREDRASATEREGYCPRSLVGGPLGHCGTLPQKPSQYCCPTPCSQATRLKKLSPAHRAMASLICCQRLGCTAEGAGVAPCATGPAGDPTPVDPGGEAVAPVDPGGAPGTAALPGALPSVLGRSELLAAPAPGSVVSLLVASLVAGLEPESDFAGGDCMDTESWTGGSRAGMTTFGGSGAGTAVELVDAASPAATRGEVSLGKSIR